MCALEINTKWEIGGAAYATKIIPTVEGAINIFKSYKVTKEEIKTHSELVWDNTDFGVDTPRYFNKFATAPVDKAILDAKQNTQRLKYAMLGNQICNIISSDFKVEISGSKEEFQRGQDFDGPLAQDFIYIRIDPTTIVEDSKLKDEIEIIKPEKFNNAIIE